VTDDRQTENAASEGTSASPCYVAIATQSSQVGPESWDVYPITKTLTRQTTIGELVDWYKIHFPNAKSVQGIRFSQAT